MELGFKVPILIQMDRSSVKEQERIYIDQYILGNCPGRPVEVLKMGISFRYRTVRSARLKLKVK